MNRPRQQIVGPTTLLCVTGILMVLHTGSAVASSQTRVVWWHNPPYLIAPSYPTQGNPKNVLGVLGGVITSVLTRCLPEGDRVSFHQVDNPWDFQVEMGKVLNTTETVLCMVFPKKTGYRPVVTLPERTVRQADGTRRTVDYTFLPVLESPGAVQFYKQKEEAVGSDLLTVILQGWPLLILILLGASYSGIIIWLLDRLWNPTNFPKPFIRGFWEGFWWAFVTMTTVGYGDTTPRSVQARIYGLIWIVVGITILSVFTATVTTVLTQESLGVHHRIQGLKVAVLNGTEEYRLALEKGGYPIEFNSFDEMVKVLERRDPEGALLDQYSFATQQGELEDNILVEEMLENPVQHGIMLSGPDEGFNQCIQKATEQASMDAFMKLTRWISPLTTKTTTAAEQAETLFQPRTVLYMWYGLAAWVVVFVGFVLWEFVYWRPKHKKKKEDKKNANPEADIRPPPEPSPSEDSSEESTPGNSLRATPTRATKPTDNSPTGNAPTEQQQCTSSETPLQTLQVVSSELETPRHLQNGYLANMQPHTRVYTNYAFERELPGPGVITTDPEKRGASVATRGSLDSLVQRQKDELARLKEEFEEYRQLWESRLKDLKRLQREERKEFLKTLQAGHRNVEDTTSENVSEPHAVTLQNDLSRHGDNVSCYDFEGVKVYEV